MAFETFAVHAACIRGVEAIPVTVEVSLAGGVPGIQMLGIPSMEVMESRGRIRCAMRSAGFDAVNVPVAKDLGMTVLRVPAYSPEAIAEQAIGLGLCAARRIHKGYLRVRENDFSLQGLLGVNLHGKTAGIVGTGKIGAAMVRICNGFGMKVLGYDVYQNPSLEGMVEYVELDELLRRSDLISLHCPLFDSNRHMINADAIAQMKDGVVFLNFSRDVLVDDAAMAEALASGKVAAYVTDFANPAVVKMERAIVIPHLGASTAEAEDNCAKMAVEEVMAYLERGEKIHCVNM